jgi:hypothetical protein
VTRVLIVARVVVVTSVVLVCRLSVGRYVLVRPGVAGRCGWSVAPLRLVRSYMRMMAAMATPGLRLPVGRPVRVVIIV